MSHHDVMSPENSERQIDHLNRFQKRFEPGQSGNPGGRPRQRSLSKAAREKLDQINPVTGLTYAQEIVDALVKEGKRGNVWAAKELREWTEGKVPLAIQAEVNHNENGIQQIKEKLLQKLVTIEARENLR